MKPAAVKHGVRKEANRSFLVEKSQPVRNLFAIGTSRHNVHSKELKDYWQNHALEKGNTSIEKPDRIIQWKEESHKQSYDKK